METIEYTDKERAAFTEPGPWDREPDKIQYEDPDTGYPCLVKRTSLGHLCGYVGVPEGHPAHGHDDGTVYESFGDALNVHRWQRRIGGSWVYL